MLSVMGKGNTAREGNAASGVSVCNFRVKPLRRCLNKDFKRWRSWPCKYLGEAF